MPSFSTDVKNEIARLMYKKRCCQNAELAALLRMGASMTIGSNRSIGLSFKTENAAVARKCLQLLKATEQVQTEVTVSRSRTLHKTNRYTVRVVPSPRVQPLLENLGLMQGGLFFGIGDDKALIKKRCCRRAYLRGAFLGGGSVNRPESLEYHLELVTQSYSFAQTLVDILRKMGYGVGFTERKKNYLIYMKDADSIEAFLAMLEADRAVERFDGARNIKEVHSQINRIVNCETANLQRTVAASIQIQNRLRLLESKGILKGLPEKLQEAARVRIENPDASLSELAELLGISKSGITHRLKKLEAMADELQSVQSEAKEQEKDKNKEAGEKSQ